MVFRKKQGGYVEITTMAALAVMSMLALVQADKYMEDQRNMLAETAAQTAAQIVNAIRSKVAVDNVAITTGTFTGTGWLKDAACTGGSGSQSHLFCSFSDRLPFGMSYSTVVTNVAGAVTATLTLGAPTTSEGVTPYLADHIAVVMNGAGNTFWTPNNQTYFQASVAAGSVVQAVVSNAPANQEFIARDGTAGPTNHHDWNNFDITNIGNLQVNGSVAAGSLTTPIGSITTLNSTIGNITTVNSTTMNATTLNVAADANIGDDVNVTDDLSVGDLVDASRMETNSFRLTANSTEGSGCPGVRYLGATSTGKYLQCIGGIWKKMGEGIVAEDLFGTDGYVEFSNGFIDMWGKVRSPNSEYDIVVANFPRRCPVFLNGTTNMSSRSDIHDDYEPMIYDFTQTRIRFRGQGDRGSWSGRGSIYWRVTCRA